MVGIRLGYMVALIPRVHRVSHRAMVPLAPLAAIMSRHQLLVCARLMFPEGRAHMARCVEVHASRHAHFSMASECCRPSSRRRHDHLARRSKRSDIDSSSSHFMTQTQTKHNLSFKHTLHKLIHHNAIQYNAIQGARRRGCHRWRAA